MGRLFILANSRQEDAKTLKETVITALENRSRLKPTYQDIGVLESIIKIDLFLELGMIVWRFGNVVLIIKVHSLQQIKTCIFYT